MKFLLFRNRNFNPVIFLKNNIKSLAILLLGILTTLVIAYEIRISDTKSINQDFGNICNDLVIKIEGRLKAHAQLIRSGSAYIMASDTVTGNEWREFNEREKINRNLPGIQGVGYSILISKNEMNRHIKKMRKVGFPDYVINPPGNRAVYSSIIYLEPFTGRNIRAFGYDMFSEPIRRKAMEIARDSDIAMLSGKLILVQETREDMQAGTIMYVPVYRHGLPINTIEERRSAIKGWVFSPYRMKDLMGKILGSWDLPFKNRIHLKIFDNFIQTENLLYDSQISEKEIDKPDLNLQLPVFFNGRKWIVQFTQESKDLYLLKWKLGFVLISGFSISFLLFALLVALFNSKNRESHIQLLNDQLEKHNADKDRFISILAHDLKSPFTALLGFVELLNTNVRNYPLDKIESFVGNIHNSLKSTYHLLEDILMWARIQSGKMPFEPMNVNLQLICKDVIRGLKLSADIKNITIEDGISCDIDLYADKNMLNTILRNLFSNAIKFTNKGGAVKILANQNAGEVIITVLDNGIGIESDILYNLFDKLNLYSTKGTENEKGTGFGLLLCKEFVEKHKGKIWVESEVGKGSSFKFSMKQYPPVFNHMQKK